jgi:hypothetical protein
LKLYDELIAGVDGYCVERHRSHRCTLAIRAQMDTCHKVSAAEHLFALPTESNEQEAAYAMWVELDYPALRIAAREYYEEQLGMGPVEAAGDVANRRQSSSEQTLPPRTLAEGITWIDYLVWLLSGCGSRPSFGNCMRRMSRGSRS